MGIPVRPSVCCPDKWPWCWFLIILVGTALKVLTDQYRNTLRVSRWRRKLKDHVIVCGYGTKGRAAVGALLETGFDKSRIVIVENREVAVYIRDEESSVTGVAV